MKNFGVLETKLPQNVYEPLLKECTQPLSNANEFITGITSKGVSKQYYIEKNKNLLDNFVLGVRDRYDKEFPGLDDIRVLTNGLPVKVNPSWYNIQTKHQFVPNHTHDGIYSFVIWMKIPYEYEVEEPSGEGFTSCFEFTYTNNIGNIRNHVYKLGKKYEGTMLMFPSKLQHCVYPFYTSDDVRISISGNIVLDAG